MQKTSQIENKNKHIKKKQDSVAARNPAPTWGVLE